MYAFPVVEKLDVFKNPTLGFLAGSELLQIDEFLFEHAVERFDAGIVIAVALAAHAAFHPVFQEPFLVLMRCVLAAAIGMMQDFAFRPLTVVSLIQSLQDQFLGHSLIGVPAYDFARVQVHHARDIEPSLVCRNVSDVRHPDLIGSLCPELLVQHIVMHWQIVVRVRRRLVCLDGARLKPQFLHDAGDRFFGYPNTLLAQDLSDLRAAVQATRVHKDTANLLF